MSREGRGKCVCVDVRKGGRGEGLVEGYVSNVDNFFPVIIPVTLP